MSPRPASVEPLYWMPDPEVKPPPNTNTSTGRNAGAGAGAGGDGDGDGGAGDQMLSWRHASEVGSVAPT